MPGLHLPPQHCELEVQLVELPSSMHELQTDEPPPEGAAHTGQPGAHSFDSAHTEPQPHCETQVEFSHLPRQQSESVVQEKLWLLEGMQQVPKGMEQESPCWQQSGDELARLHPAPAPRVQLSAANKIPDSARRAAKEYSAAILISTFIAPQFVVSGK